MMIVARNLRGFGPATALYVIAITADDRNPR